MDSVYRDLSRLNLILQLPIGQEGLSSTLYMKNFTSYYFNRFVDNLTHVFEDFSYTEIEDFNKRYKEKIYHFITKSEFVVDHLIVPIPKGMINSYKETLTSLLSILDIIKIQTVANDLNSIIVNMESMTLTKVNSNLITSKIFENLKNDISKMFGKMGLRHSLSGLVMGSRDDIDKVNGYLLNVTKTYYPDIIKINQLLKTIEAVYSKITWSDQDKLTLSNHFMTMAYRLSILAVVMDHVQDIEHTFVKSLDIILRNSH